MLLAKDGVYETGMPPLLGLCSVAVGSGWRRLLDRNRIGRRKGVLEGFVKRLFLASSLALVAIVIVLMRFAFRLDKHFDFSVWPLAYASRA